MYNFTQNEQFLKRFLSLDLKKLRNKKNSNGYGYNDFLELINADFHKLMVSDENGGCGFTAVEAMIVINEIAKCDAGLAHLIATNNFCFWYLIELLGTDEQKSFFKNQKYKIGTLAYNEATSEIKTMYKKIGDNYYISGVKSMITAVSYADVVLVYATEADGQAGTMFIIELKGNDNIHIGKSDETMGMESLEIADIILDNVCVKSKDILFGEKNGLKCIIKSMELMRITNSAIALGISESALEVALKQAKEYYVNNTNLIDMQYIKYELAHMKAEIENMELMTFYMAHKYDLKLNNMFYYSSVGKYLSAEKAKDICDRCLQMFGGYGYIKGYPIEKMYRDVRVLSIIGGTKESMKEIIFRHLENFE